MRAQEMPFVNLNKRKAVFFFIYVWPHERGRIGGLQKSMGRQSDICDEMLSNESLTYKGGPFVLCDDGGNLNRKREIFEELVIEAKKKKAAIFIASHDRLSDAEHSFAQAAGVEVVSGDGQPACWLVYTNTNLERNAADAE